MKILIVEDSRAIAAVMAARLSSLGHAVDIAENGAVGVGKATTESVVQSTIIIFILNYFLSMFLYQL